MTQGVPGEDEMTSRAGEALMERLASLDAVSVEYAPAHSAPYWSRYIVEPIVEMGIRHIEKEVRDDIRARVEALRKDADEGYAMKSDTDDPVAYDAGRIGAFDAVLAVISSSSATETHGMTHRELLAYKAGELAGRQAERLGVGATETQDGRAPVFVPVGATEGAGMGRAETQDGLPDANRVGGYSAYGEPYAEDAYDSATETQDGERPGYAEADELQRRLAATPTPDDRDREVERIDVARLYEAIRRIALREGHPGHNDLRSGLTTPGLGHGYEVTLAGAIAEEYDRGT